MKRVLYTVLCVIFLWDNSFSATLGPPYNQEWYLRPNYDRYGNPDTSRTPLYNKLIGSNTVFTPLHNKHNPLKREDIPPYVYFNSITPSGIPAHIQHTSPDQDTTPLYGYWPATNVPHNPGRLTNTQMRPERFETPLYDGYEGVHQGSPPLYGYWVQNGGPEGTRAPLTAFDNRYSPNMLPGPPLNLGTQGDGDRQAGSSLGGILGSGFGTILNPYLGNLGTSLGKFLGPILGSFGIALLRLISSMDTGMKTLASSYEATPGVAKCYDAYLADFPEYGKYIVLVDPTKPNPFLKTKEGSEDKVMSPKPLDENEKNDAGGKSFAKNVDTNINDEGYSVDNFKNLMEHKELFPRKEEKDAKLDVSIGSN